MALIDNLVSYWKFDESNGDAVDSHGSNTLTNRNVATFAAGKINNGTDLEVGSTQEFYITDAAQSGLDVVGDLSIAGWVKFESLPASGNKWFLIFKNDSYMFRCTDNPSGTHCLLIYLRDATNFYYATVNWTPSTATWYHVVVTREKATGYVFFYVDGAQQGARQDTGHTADLLNTADNFGLGGSGYGGQFDGMIDEVGIWSKVLSSSEVSQLYNSGAGLAYPFSTGTTVFPSHTLLTLGVG